MGGGFAYIEPRHYLDRFALVRFVTKTPHQQIHIAIDDRLLLPERSFREAPRHQTSEMGMLLAVSRKDSRRLRVVGVKGRFLGHLGLPAPEAVDVIPALARAIR